MSGSGGRITSPRTAPAVKQRAALADNSNEGYDRLRPAPQPTHRRQRRSAAQGELSQQPSAPFQINPLTELVADLLAATGLIPPDKLAIVRGRAAQGSIAQAIIDEGVASAEGVARTLAARYNMPLVDLLATKVDEEAVKLIPLHVLERVDAIPYALEGDTLKVAISDPGNINAIDELRLATRHQVELAVASRDDILVEIRRLVRASEAFGARAAVDEGFIDEEEEEADDLEVDDGISEAPLVRLVNSVIFQAAEDGASDIHFEPQEDSLVVRYRVDGVLQEVQRIPKRMAAGVTTRLKVLAKLDIAERRKPQDGRISLNAAAAGRMLDIRVATLPTVEGESLVMRLLDKSKKPPTLQELGLSDEMRVTLEEIVNRPTGALLVTGPTGSGKSTTLYASLNKINRPEINIITVEDPVEYRLAGRQPGADQRARRADVRGGPALDPAFRPRRGDGRRDPRRRDRQDLDRGRPDRPLRALDPAHQRRAGRDHPSQRDGRRAVPRRLGRHRRARAAPRAQALLALLRDVPAGHRGAAPGARLARRGGRRPTGWPSTASAAARGATRPATRAGSASSSSSR